MAKKTVIFIISVILVFLLSGCGNPESEFVTPSSTVKQTEEVSSRMKAESDVSSDIVSSGAVSQQDAVQSSSDASSTLNSTTVKSAASGAESRQQSAAEKPTEQTQTPSETQTVLKSMAEAEKTARMPTQTELEIFNLVNIERQKIGVPVLKYNRGIYVCADTRSKEAAEKWSHDRPTGDSFLSVYVDCGIEPPYWAGENLGSGFLTAGQIMEAFMLSDDHRTILLDKDFTTLCVSVYQAADGTFYVAQLFTS